MKYQQSDKSSIQGLFNKISNKYDLLNDFMSFGLHRSIKKRAIKKTIQFLAYTPEKILDVCTGTGDIAIEFKKQCLTTEIIGIDFSANMLEIARKNSQNISFLEKDVTNLYEEEFFEKNSFDIIFISFGLRNLPDIDQYMQDIKPYLKTGGTIAILEVGTPVWFMRPYFAFHYNILIPMLAWLKSKDLEAYKYLIHSSKNYPPQKTILQKLEKHGYTHVKNINYSFGVIAQQLAKSE